MENRTTIRQLQNDNFAHALAGSGGGILSMVLTYPLITLSTRAQVESKRARSSTIDAAKRIVQREGVAGLYAGMNSALFGISVTNFVYYYWYEWAKNMFERAAIRTGRHWKMLTTLESIMAGALAGVATVLITNPIWVVNTRMMASKSKDSQLEEGENGTTKESANKSLSTFGTLASIIRTEGFWRLFAGVIPALVLVLNPILQYTIFEQLRNALERKKSVTPSDSFYLGAFGKLLATSITYPYITVKGRMHLAGTDRSTNIFTSFRNILKDEGWSGLYGGIGPKVTQSVITAAFLFAFKDAIYAMTVKARRKIAAKK